MSRQRQREIVPRRRWLFPMGAEREYVRFAKKLAAADADLDMLRDHRQIAAVVEALKSWCVREGVPLDRRGS